MQRQIAVKTVTKQQPITALNLYITKLFACTFTVQLFNNVNISD